MVPSRRQVSITNKEENHGPKQWGPESATKDPSGKIQSVDKADGRPSRVTERNDMVKKPLGSLKAIPEGAIP